VHIERCELGSLARRALQLPVRKRIHVVHAYAPLVDSFLEEEFCAEIQDVEGLEYVPEGERRLALDDLVELNDFGPVAADTLKELLAWRRATTLWNGAEPPPPNIDDGCLE
jgi:hypothetical protein